jgi:hypothetical protein
VEGFPAQQPALFDYVKREQDADADEAGARCGKTVCQELCENLKETDGPIEGELEDRTDTTQPSGGQ